MLNWKRSLAFVVAISASSAIHSAFAQDDRPADVAAETVHTATVSGKLVLPGTMPDWFNGGELDLSQAVVFIEGTYERPEFPYPDGWEEMSSKEKADWYTTFEHTDEYKAFEDVIREAYNNRPYYKLEVDRDGSFKAEGLRPDKYTVEAFIPHADANDSNIFNLSWATGFNIFTVESEGQVVSAGDINMVPGNVVMVGDLAPDWTATTYGGSEIKLSDFRGKYVLIDFWATWCGPCIGEMPNLEAVYQEFGGDRFEIVALSLDRTIDEPKAFHENRPSAFTHAYLGQFMRNENTSRKYGVNTTGIPAIFLVGPDGKVVARDLNGKALRDAVRLAVESESD